MKKWTLLDKATTPDGSEISLLIRDGEYTIRVDGLDLMSTRQHASEDKLGELACAHLAKKPKGLVLIGGLGFGYTLKSVLASTKKDTTVLVAELMPAIIEWNKNPAYQFGAKALATPRVKTIVRDVRDLIRESNEVFDTIILDVDNGPAALTTESNQLLYQEVGLKLIYRALKPDGMLAVWSVNDSKSFVKNLARAGLISEVHHARAHETSGGLRTIFLGRKPRAKS